MEQVVADDDLVAVFLHHRGRGVILRGGELEQKILFVLREDALDSVFPTLEHLHLGFGLDVDVMGFVRNQHHSVLTEVFKGDSVFFFSCQVRVEFLNRREADVDAAGIDAFKVLYWRNAHAAVANHHFLIEKIFDGGGIEEVVFGLFDDVGGVDKEQEVAVSPARRDTESAPP